MAIYLLYSLGTLIFGLLGLLVWKGFATNRTFSQKAATSRASIIYYVVLFSVALPMLYLFFAELVIVELQLSDAFYLIMVISLLGQFICTLFPEKGGTVVAHRLFTGISGTLLLPMLVMIALSPRATLLVSWAAILSVAIMSALLVVGLMNQSGHRYALWLQVGYYTLFFIPLLLIIWA
jgi:hypothetical protein